MKIIGIDPGKRSIGMCIYHGGEYQAFEIKNKGTQEEILKELPGILFRKTSWFNTKVVIEGYPYGLKSAYIFDRAEIVGVMKHYFITWGCEYEEVNPSLWKSEFFGKGWRKLKKRTANEKQEYIERVRMVTGIEADGVDSADALAIVRWYVDRRVLKGMRILS